MSFAPPLPYAVEFFSALSSPQFLPDHIFESELLTMPFQLLWSSVVNAFYIERPSHLFLEETTPDPSDFQMHWYISMQFMLL